MVVTTRSSKKRQHFKLKPVNVKAVKAVKAVTAVKPIKLGSSRILEVFNYPTCEPGTQVGDSSETAKTERTPPPELSSSQNTDPFTEEEIRGLVAAASGIEQEDGNSTDTSTEKRGRELDNTPLRKSKRSCPVTPNPKFVSWADLNTLDFE